VSVTFTFGQMVEDPEHGVILVRGARCREHVCTLNGPCEDAALYGSSACEHAEADREACGCEALDVNMANANAALVLGRLGLPASDDGDGLCGEASPDDILGRALTGNVGLDDTGTADVTSRAPGGPLVVDCGLPAGYFTRQLDAIAALAAEAKARGLLVAWA
jgi:hypothetical protein